jgi:hypothetical protein
MTADKKTVSIAVIETENLKGALRAVKSTLANTPASWVYWVSDQPCPETLPVPITWLRIRKFKPTAEQFNTWYSEITLRLLPQAVQSDYNIIVQADGFAVNGSAWTDEFLEYDYIGAPWTWWGPEHEQVGNGGFSWRSRRLYDALVQWNPGWTRQDWPDLDPKYYDPMGKSGITEDNLLAGPYRQYLEKHHALRWASSELAHRWSIECSESYTSKWFKTSLGFHGRETAKHYGIDLTNE